MRREIARAFDGKEIEITVSRKKKKRTNPQNRYYFGVVIPMIRAGMKGMGDIVDVTEVHDSMRWRFLKQQRIDESTGELLYEFALSTTQLDTVGFTEYIEHCRRFAAEFLGIDIPDPEP